MIDRFHSTNSKSVPVLDYKSQPILWLFFPFHFFLHVCVCEFGGATKQTRFVIGLDTKYTQIQYVLLALIFHKNRYN